MVFVDGHKSSVPDLANALLGARDERGYLEWLEERWPQRTTRRAVRRWLRDTTITRLRTIAALAAETGRFPYAEAADDLANIAYDAFGAEVTARSFPDLAFWSLKDSVESGFGLSECEECGYWWISHAARHPKAAEFSTYCRRPHPGGKMSCHQLHAHDRFARRRADWNKEYRRIYARKLRGTVSEQDWLDWRNDPHGSARAPEHFLNFDSWKLVALVASEQAARTSPLQDLIKEALDNG